MCTPRITLFLRFRRRRRRSSHWFPQKLFDSGAQHVFPEKSVIALMSGLVANHPTAVDQNHLRNYAASIRVLLKKLVNRFPRAESEGESDFVSSHEIRYHGGADFIERHSERLETASPELSRQFFHILAHYLAMRTGREIKPKRHHFAAVVTQENLFPIGHQEGVLGRFPRHLSG